MYVNQIDGIIDKILDKFYAILINETILYIK